MEYIFYKGFKIIKSPTYVGRYQVDPMYYLGQLSQHHCSLSKCKKLIDNIINETRI